MGAPEKLAEEVRGLECFGVVTSVPETIPEVAEHLASNKGWRHLSPDDLRQLKSLPPEELDGLMDRANISRLIVLGLNEDWATCFQHRVITPMLSCRHFLPSGCGFIFRK